MTRPATLAVVPGLEEPIYRQIVGQIARAISSRTMKPGERLAPYRELAELLVVSPLAVKKAYDDLLAGGLCHADGDDLRVAVPSSERRWEWAHRELYANLLQHELSLRELLMARRVQCRLLPPGHVTGEGFEVAARCQPARFVTGDFYDVIQLADGSVGTVVADVAGKGIGPSLIMATVKAVMPFLAAGRRVEDTLSELNRRLCAELERREFVALVYARLEPRSGRLRFADAGLPAPVLLRFGEDPEELPVAGPRLPLGLRPGVEYWTSEVTLGRGDRLLFYTDGIPEAATGNGEILGYEELLRLIAELHRDRASLSAERWLDALLEVVRKATGKASSPGAADAPFDLKDDLTVLMIERT